MFLTIKFLNFGTLEYFAVIYLKLKKEAKSWVFRQKDAFGIANSEDPDLTAHLPLIQEEHLSVNGEMMCAEYW